LKHIFSGTTFLAILACLLWSSAFVGVKVGLDYSSPLQFAGVRFFISGLMILPFAGGLKRYWHELRNNLKIVLTISFLNTFLQYTLFYTGLSLVPAALAAIVIGAAPLFIAFMSHFMMKGDRMTWVKMAVFLAGFSGIVLVSLGRNRFSDVEEVGILGIIVLLGVNLVSGLGNIFVAKDAGTIPPYILSSSTMIIGGASLMIVSVPLEGINTGPFPPVFFIALGWLSFLSAAAISIWFALLKRPGVKVSELNFWKFLIPVSGAVLAWLFLPGEKPTLVAISGMLIIALSLVGLNYIKRKQKNGRA